MAVGRSAAGLSTRFERRILRARKTGKLREFELMLALRPRLPAVVAEGDSWFAYPPPNLVGIDSRSNIVNWLSRAADLNLLQLASNGDEAVAMLSGRNKHRLIEVLRRFPLDFLLFSGGGNDIVGQHDFEFLLREGRDMQSPDCRDYLRLDRVERRLDMVGSAYADLLDFCQDYSRNRAIRIVTHCYDYALPSPVGASFASGLLQVDGGRSWMYPALVARGIPPGQHGPIARFLIDQLAARLHALAGRSAGRLHVIDTRGLLGPDEWINEIHPDRRGFARIGAAVLTRLSQLDPRLARRRRSR